MKRTLQFFSALLIFTSLALMSFGQADVTITIDDQTQSYVKIMFKGTPTDWDTIPMFDDGTNGDVTAGDHIWTVILSQVPEGDHEWGAIEDDGSQWGIWLIQGPNLMFNVTGSEVTGETSYTIPVVEEVYIEQAFTVTNDNWENVPFSAVSYKGTLTQWSNIPMYDDGTNGDETAGDHIWTTMIMDTVPVGDHEWGAVDQDDSWLISGPNVACQVTMTGEVTGNTNYTIPAWGDVPVTFTVDLNCQFNAGIMTLDSCLDVAMDGYPPVELEYIGEGDYQVTITRFNVGEELAYWYRIGCADDRPVTQQEYPGPDNNRSYTVVDGTNEIPEVWYQDDILDEPCEYQFIGEFGEEIEVAIYPNPAIEVIKIDIINARAIDRIIVSNMLGQAVTTIEEVTDRMEVPVFDYKEGIYFITLVSKGGAKHTQKILVQ